MRNVFSYLYNRTKNQIRVSFGRKIYFFVSWTSFRDFLSTNTNLTYGFPMIFHRLRTNNYCMESIIWLTIRKVPTIASVNSSLLCISYHLPFHHLHQINPTSYFLHIPEIVSTIESNSFKDKISTILHFLEHIVKQNFFPMDKSRPARWLLRTFLLFNVSTLIFIINLSSYNIY